MNLVDHVHAVPSLGLFDKKAAFHPVPEDIDFGPLEELFREHAFKVLLNKGAVTEERVGGLLGLKPTLFA
jgi:hypothetical protein